MQCRQGISLEKTCSRKCWGYARLLILFANTVRPNWECLFPAYQWPGTKSRVGSPRLRIIPCTVESGHSQKLSLFYVSWPFFFFPSHAWSNEKRSQETPSLCSLCCLLFGVQLLAWGMYLHAAFSLLCLWLTGERGTPKRLVKPMKAATVCHMWLCTRKQSIAFIGYRKSPRLQQ